ncbi:potassium channel family protein [Shewanella eurypsychrophilus]|uniref:Potassium channel family protein n=1 Tax=Shewanella eurypsychrophilus TaxID=2593656 RepID=A0ABX6VAI4_9GAMM|nr:MULTISPECIES: potassium channel family protein [Shewanella]QFU23804.1 two pore domain potassium channel family protein [Shewanella sp. YLB-09]QPG59027.1 potassium channel family protein [Shewanella eurypsychrophilus]
MGHKITQEDNFGYLLLSLIFLLLGSAIAEQLLHGGQIMIVATTIICLSIAVIGVGKDKLMFRNGLGILLAIVALSTLGSMMETLNLDLITLLAILGFLLMSTWTAAKQVLFSGKITSNQIIGSICIFLLMGLIWAMIYLINIELFGQAFNGLEVKPWTDNFTSVIYYSFITLTTVGYGEISPALPVPRALAYMEAIAGQFYMAILVASLVGAKMSQSHDS